MSAPGRCLHISGPAAGLEMVQAHQTQTSTAGLFSEIDGSGVQQAVC